MFVIKRNEKYLMKSGTWTDKRKDAMRFPTKSSAEVMIKAKKLDSVKVEAG
jgi:hypothetical protein